MAGVRTPGVLCGSRSKYIDKGTLCLWRTPAPGPVCRVPEAQQRRDLHLWVVGPEEAALLKAPETLHLMPYDDKSGVDISAFNIGVGGCKGSSVVQLVKDPKANTGHASLETTWNRSQGKMMKGLDNRRTAEWRNCTKAVHARW